MKLHGSTVHIEQQDYRAPQGTRTVIHRHVRPFSELVATADAGADSFALSEPIHVALVPYFTDPVGLRVMAGICAECGRGFFCLGHT